MDAVTLLLYIHKLPLSVNNFVQKQCNTRGMQIFE